ncbi:MAG: rhamnulokinase family protein [Gemmatimonadota bacterium]
MSGKGHRLIAFDLGAESGRAILGQLDGRRLELTELHRFANGPVRVFDRLYWDPLRLFGELKAGLRAFAAQHGRQLDGLGMDTWGVDFALLGRDGSLLENPRHYRDARTDGMMERAFERVPREEIFAHTGAQFMKLNTLYQLLAMKVQASPVLEIATHFLMMPDLFNYLFTGEKVSEFTDATTTQFYDPRQGRWATELLARLDLPTHFLPPIIQPGSTVGPLLASVAEECGVAAAPVLAPATHDTGSAVAAVPAATRDYAYISSGTWSLMGVLLDEPLVAPEALRYNFTNEGGVGSTYRFLKNIMGLWLVQECRRTWQRQGRELSYAELASLAAAAPPFTARVDPDDEGFLAPGDMVARILAYLRRSGQPEPAGEGGLIRVVLESLALKYRYTLESVERILGRAMECIHIVGGGIQNELLCQLTADATGRPVIAGPLEATAIGNLMVQALARGYVSSADQIREVVRHSFDPVSYEPRPDARWDAAYEHFQSLLPAA